MMTKYTIFNVDDLSDFQLLSLGNQEIPVSTSLGERMSEIWIGWTSLGSIN